MFPYSSAAVPLDNGVNSLTTLFSNVLVAFTPVATPAECSTSVIVQTVIASPAE